MIDKRLWLMVALGAALTTGSFGIAFAQQYDQPAGQTPGPNEQQAEQQGNRATEALNLLENRGDGQFANFLASGQNFTADVTRNGTTQEVLINPDTRQIQPISGRG